MGEGRGKDAFWKKNNSEWGLWDNQPAWSQISGLGQVEGQAAVIEEGFPHENWLKTRKKKLFFFGEDQEDSRVCHYYTRM